MDRRIKKRFALVEGGPKRLLVSCGRDCDNVSVVLDGFEIQPDGGAGPYYTLPDGSSLAVNVWPAQGTPQFGLVLDGKHLPGTFFNPHTRIRAAGITLFSLAGASLLLPSEPVIDIAPYITVLPLVPVALGCAAVFALLGIGVLRLSELAARAGALLGALVSGCFVVPLFLSQTAGLEVWAVPFALFWIVYQAVDAIEELRGASA